MQLPASRSIHARYRRKHRITCAAIAIVAVFLLLGMPLGYTVANGTSYTFWTLNPWLGFAGIDWFRPASLSSLSAFLPLVPHVRIRGNK